MGSIDGFEQVDLWAKNGDIFCPGCLVATGLNWLNWLARVARAPFSTPDFGGLWGLHLTQAARGIWLTHHFQHNTIQFVCRGRPCRFLIPPLRPTRPTTESNHNLCFSAPLCSSARGSSQLVKINTSLPFPLFLPSPFDLVTSIVTRQSKPPTTRIGG